MPRRARGPRARRLIAALLLAASLPGLGCATVTPKLRPGHVGFIAATAGDVVSTRRALDAGAVEINPLLGEHPSTAKLVGLKLGGWMALRGLEGFLESEIRRDLSWWESALFWLIPTGLAAWATQHNLAVARSYE